MKYEYKLVKADDLLSAKQLTDVFGVERWKLVTVLQHVDGSIYHYFVRVIED
jgi:hypothetical protein